MNIISYKSNTVQKNLTQAWKDFWFSEEIVLSPKVKNIDWFIWVRKIQLKSRVTAESQ